MIRNFQLYTLLVLYILHEYRYLESGNHWNVANWVTFQL